MTQQPLRFATVTLEPANAAIVFFFFALNLKPKTRICRHIQYLKGAYFKLFNRKWQTDQQMKSSCASEKNRPNILLSIKYILDALWEQWVTLNHTKMGNILIHIKIKMCYHLKFK